MARKPKAQPSTEPAAAILVEELAAKDKAPSPATRGRKQKPAAPSSELLLATHGGGAATNEAEAATHTAEPVEAPRRRGPGRKQMPSVAVEVAPLLQNKAEAQRGPKSRKPEAEPPPDLIEDDARPAEMASPVEGAAGGDPIQPETDPGSPNEDAQQPLPGLVDTPAPMRPAAIWDRATDTVRFDWPGIERTAAQEGPNQGMAKLLVAARAEGANSRWPL